MNWKPHGMASAQFSTTRNDHKLYYYTEVHDKHFSSKLDTAIPTQLIFPFRSQLLSSACICIY